MVLSMVLCQLLDAIIERLRGINFKIDCMR